ncbi:PREDICTED: probable long-chain-alcohol O-fatty-acyltransferase 2 [Camelina sativa]|uniref:Probable long-chain-alcohol O-fatty-acyltransferase 2 n=1 Tax=Camelina sativa TaxID=90675 RepID=A0ABM0XA92_CAMSA|nr:PREDICTED: probable long-chain-alcohol O-fatty-acyltransferase 2 [Camelina sativa]
MEEELRNLIKVWISVLISTSYCYYISAKLPKGFLRLLSILPIFITFLLLPLLLSSVHFCAISSFFFTWLANFKLLLFAFDQEPLSPLPSNLSRFFCFSCFPIKTNIRNPSSNRIYNKPISKWVLAIKILIFSFILHVYSNNYDSDLSQSAFLALFIIHVYLEAELILVFVRALLSTLLGCDLEPVFNEPYLATSLQDFWSRRWNLMVPAVLRPAVHIPVQRFTAPLLGLQWAFSAGMLATFLVSGLMHELIYFYIIRKPPTWEVTCFFLLHGVVTSAEIAIKRMRWLPPPHKAVSGLAVAAFVLVTAGWLFYPQVLRNDVHKRVISECLLVTDVVKNKLSLF